MVSESGGKNPREGFRYQDYVAACFFITNIGSTHSSDNSPAELHIEQEDADFSYFIRDSDREIGHYFEVKHKESGELKWSTYKNNVLTEFSKIYKADERATDVDSFHTVVNTTFARRINDLLEDAEKLRVGEYNTLGLWNRREREYKSTLKSELPFDDPNELLSLIRFLVGHSFSEEFLDNKLEEFLEKCNPRSPRRSKRIVLQEINDISSGVISRSDLEDEIEHKLEPVQSSSSSSNIDSEELWSNLQRIRSELPQENRRDIYDEARIHAKELSNQIDSDDPITDERVETETSGVVSSSESLLDISKDMTEKEHTLSKHLDSLLELTEAQFGSTEGEKQ